MNKPLAILLSLLIVGLAAWREYRRFERGTSFLGDLGGPHGGWLIGAAALVGVVVLYWLLSRDEGDPPPGN